MYDQNQQAFGHFGAPDVLPQSYGAGNAQPILDLAKQATEPQQSEQYFWETRNYSLTDAPTTSHVFTRGDKPLPYIKNGATDAQVQTATGIIGLITEIQARMKVTKTGTIRDDQIKEYQRAKGITVDGIIGPETYAKLELPGPYVGGSSSRSSSSRSSSVASPPPPIGKEPFYKNKYFIYGMSGVLLLGAGYFIYSMQKK